MGRLSVTTAGVVKASTGTNNRQRGGSIPTEYIRCILKMPLMGNRQEGGGKIISAGFQLDAEEKGLKMITAFRLSVKNHSA